MAHVFVFYQELLLMKIPLPHNKRTEKKWEKRNFPRGVYEFSPEIEFLTRCFDRSCFLEVQGYTFLFFYHFVAKKIFPHIRSIYLCRATITKKQNIKVHSWSGPHHVQPLALCLGWTGLHESVGHTARRRFRYCFHPKALPLTVGRTK